MTASLTTIPHFDLYQIYSFLTFRLKSHMKYRWPCKSFCKSIAQFKQFSTARCYTTGWNNRACNDLKPSKKFPSNPWSYSACGSSRSGSGWYLQIYVIKFDFSKIQARLFSYQFDWLNRASLLILPLWAIRGIPKCPSWWRKLWPVKHCKQIAVVRNSRVPSDLIWTLVHGEYDAHRP